MANVQNFTIKWDYIKVIRYSNRTFDLYSRGAPVPRSFYREVRNPGFNMMSDF